MSTLDMILWVVLAAAGVLGGIAIWRRKSWRGRNGRGDGGYSDWDSGGGDGGGD